MRRAATFILLLVPLTSVASEIGVTVFDNDGKTPAKDQPVLLRVSSDNVAIRRTTEADGRAKFDVPRATSERIHADIVAGFNGRQVSIEVQPSEPSKEWPSELKLVLPVEGAGAQVTPKPGCEPNHVCTKQWYLVTDNCGQRWVLVPMSNDPYRAIADWSRHAELPPELGPTCPCASQAVAAPAGRVPTVLSGLQ